MVTTADRQPTDTFLHQWSAEHGLRAAGRWEEPQPIEVDEAAAYAVPDSEPSPQTERLKRSEVQRLDAQAAIAAVTGLDIEVDEDVDVQIVAHDALVPYRGVTQEKVDQESTPAPTPAPRASTGRTAAQFRAEKGIVRKHSKMAPSRTTPGRRLAYLKSLVAQGKYETVEDADKGTPRRPAATRYGREQAAKAGRRA